MSASRRHDRIGASAAAILFLASGQLLAGEAKAAAVKFNIERQPLAQALNTWADQAGLQIIWPVGDPVAYQNSPAVRGRLEPMTALRALLEDTGLTYSVIGEGQTVAIHSREETAGLKVAASDNATSSPGTPAARRTETLATGGGIGARQGSGSQSSKGGASNPSQAGSERGLDPLERVIVTGTHLGDASSQPSPVTVLSRRDFDAAGVSSVQEALATLPANYQGEISVEARQQAGGLGNPGANRGAASSPNIHGLGASSTLSVLNGRHLPTGSQGISSDISMIPLVAIDRIEVLRDGASPIYGADAIGGVVNFITRRGTSGAESLLRYGEATAGGLAQTQFSQSLGYTGDAASYFAAYQYDYNSSISGSDREASADYAPNPATAYPKQQQHSVYANAYFEPSSNFTPFLEFLYGSREVDETFLQFDPATGDYTLFKNAERDNKQLLGAAGFDANLGAGWSLGFSVQYAKNTLDSTGCCNATGVNYTFPFGEREWDSTVSANGTVFELPAGPVRLALGADYRNVERFLEENDGGFFPYKLTREVTAFFGEFTAPLTEQLMLTGAVRYDHYSDFGSSTNPRIGLTWEPNEVVRLRANYSTSFRAPSFAEMNVSESFYGALVMTDSESPTGVSTAIVVAGGNPNLQPEEATNISAGVDLTLLAERNLQLHLDYYHVNYTDRIATPDPAFCFFSDLTCPPIQRFLNRSPSPEVIQGYLSSPIFMNFTDGPVAATDPLVLVNNELTNLSTNKIQGLDFAASWQQSLTRGMLTLFANANILLDYEVEAQSGDPATDFAGTVFFPPDFRVRTGMQWDTAPLSVNVFVNYTPDFADRRLPQEVKIDSYTTVDASLQYRLGRRQATTIGLIVANLFDQDPPFVSTDQPQARPTYDPANASIIGRTVALQVRQRW